jgi:hypothetical protein
MPGNATKPRAHRMGDSQKEHLRRTSRQTSYLACVRYPTNVLGCLLRPSIG